MDCLYHIIYIYIYGKTTHAEATEQNLWEQDLDLVGRTKLAATFCGNVQDGPRFVQHILWEWCSDGPFACKRSKRFARMKQRLHIIPGLRTAIAGLDLR